jgi:sterol desaturase/sphingolipid hydroxylase (fatty acid hydroxylase superfamily)
MDRVLRRFIVSPNMHKVHHSDLRAEMDSNFTSILSVWDRLFGTYRERDDWRQIHFGVPGLADARFQTIGGLLRTPFVKRPRPASA